MAVATAPRGPLRNSDPGDDLVPVTKSDTLDVFGNTVATLTGNPPCSKALWVGTAGTATLVMSTGVVRTSVPLAVGVFPFRVRQVKNAGTASDIWAVIE